MTVLYLTASGEVGGGNRSLLALWPTLIERGISIRVACPQTGPMQTACERLGIPCDVVTYGQPGLRNPIQTWSGYRRWLPVLARARPDIVHANDIFGARSIALASRRAGAKLVCHIRFPPDQQSAAWAFRGLPKPHAFVFNSEALRSEAGGRLAHSYPSIPQHVVYNGIDLKSFQPAGLQPPRSTSRVGIIGNLSAIKGHKDFLQMAKFVVGDGETCRFWVVGADIAHAAYDVELKAFASTLGVSTDVEFLGYREDIADLVRQLDVVVSSSSYESFGRTLVEAMACGVPVVATAVGGVPEVVADGVTGFLVPPHNPRALADAVVRLLKDSSLRHRFGLAGRKRAEERFSVEGCGQRISAIYAQLTGRLV